MPTGVPEDSAVEVIRDPIPVAHANETSRCVAKCPRSRGLVPSHRGVQVVEADLRPPLFVFSSVIAVHVPAFQLHGKLY